jgi:hypothetical protein
LSVVGGAEQQAAAGLPGGPTCVFSVSPGWRGRMKQTWREIRHTAQNQRHTTMSELAERRVVALAQAHLRLRQLLGQPR